MLDTRQEQGREEFTFIEKNCGTMTPSCPYEFAPLAIYPVFHLLIRLTFKAILAALVAVK